ncbi:hypothetical protein LguiB_023916 [Lonicera macranthoides]
MVERLGERLPDFTDEQSEMLKGSADFIGLNYYTAKYVAATRCIDDSTYTNDPCAYLSSEWLYVYPEGIKDILRYGQRMYNNPVIYITENGVDRENQGHDPDDLLRRDYHKNHLAWLPKVIDLLMTKVSIHHKSFDRQEIGDKTQSFVTQGYFSNVAQNFSEVRAFTSKSLL